MTESYPNHLLSFSLLNHEYYALRHGQSLANVAHIISSDPNISTVQHGLSDLGRQQVLLSAQTFCEQLNQKHQNIKPIVIVSSDFLRAKETAEIYAHVLKTNAPIHPLMTLSKNPENESVTLDMRLRERFFGDWNGESDKHYTDVWSQDERDSSHTCWNVESVDCVMERTTSLILELDQKLSHIMNDISSSRSADSHVQKGTGCKCILVAHGDVLQILQTAFQKCSGRDHRSLPHLETASLRKLVLGG